MTEETTELICTSCPPVWTLERTADQGPVHDASVEPENTGKRNLPQDARDALNHAKALSVPVVDG